MEAITETKGKALSEELKMLKKEDLLEEVEEKSHQLLQLAQTGGFAEYEAEALYYQAYCCFAKGMDKDCLQYCFQSEEICEKHHILYTRILLHNLQGIVYANCGDFLSALHHYLKGYYLSIDHPEFHYHYAIINNLGTLFKEIGDEEKAGEYFIRAFQERRKQAEEYSLNDGIILSNIIISMTKLQKKEKAYWKQVYEAHFKDYDYQVLRENEIIIAIYENVAAHDLEALRQNILAFMECTKQSHDFMNSFHNYLSILQICIDLRMKELSSLLFDDLQQYMVHYHNAINDAKLADIKVEMAMKFSTQAELHQCLLDSFQQNRKAHIQEKKNNIQSMLNKIKLESALYEQHIILKRNEELLRSSCLDPFTSVYNKTAFQQAVQEALEKKAKEEKGAFFILDVDNFKNINDTYGHLCGDRVIIEVAKQLQSNIREEDIIGRIGGDEFCIYLGHILSDVYIEEKAEHLIQAIRSIRVDETKNERLTVSIGICVVKDREHYDNIFKKADHALYEAKANGRDQYVIYQSNVIGMIMKNRKKQQVKDDITVDFILPKVFRYLNVFEKNERILEDTLEFISKAMKVKNIFLLHYQNEEKTQGNIVVYDKEIGKACPYEYQHLHAQYLAYFDEKHLLCTNKIDKNSTFYKQRYLPSDIQSTLQHLILYDDKVIGILGMNDRRSHIWKEEELSLIRNLSYAFATFLIQL